RPRASTAPASPWVVQDSAAVQPIICAVDTLTAGPSSTWHRAGSAGSPGTRAPAGVSAETPAGPAAGTGGPVTTLAPAWTTTWYTSGSSAPAILAARNDSAMAARPSARSEDVRTAGAQAAGAASASGVSAAAGVTAETSSRRSPARSA